MPLAKHVQGRDPALLDCVVPVLSPGPLPGDRVVEIRNVSCRKDPRLVGFQILVDPNAAVHIDAAVAEKSNFRVNTDSNCNNIGGHCSAAACNDAFDPRRSGKLFDAFSENQLYSPRPIMFGEELGDLRRA